MLGAWAWKVRKDYRNKKLAQWKVDRLEKLEILWKVDQQTAKWHALLHEARRYKVYLKLINSFMTPWSLVVSDLPSILFYEPTQ